MALPSRVGRYEVKSRIGGGGMGTLYLARDTNPTTDRLVALKLLNANLEHADLRARFEREARSLAALSHPHIVVIHDSGEYAGAPFIVMEYVRGESLAEKIRRTCPMSIGYKLQLIAELCDGLAHAHAAGIVHRDIKPANLMVDQHGRLKILDFGIARADEGRHTQVGHPLTRLHMAIGTPGYMSPEQIEGLEIDHRSDVFSVGTVFYELLTYREAFTGATTRQIEKRVMHDDPPPIESLVPGIDPKIVAIVAEAMRKDPAERTQSARALHDAVARARAGLPAEAPAAYVTPLPPIDVGAGRESRRRRSAEAAYQRAVAAQSDGAVDFAKRSALEALAEDADHARARVLLHELGGEADATLPVFKAIEATEVVRSGATDVMRPELSVPATVVARPGAQTQGPVTMPWQPQQSRWARAMPMIGAGLVAGLALAAGLAYRDRWLPKDEPMPPTVTAPTTIPIEPTPVRDRETTPRAEPVAEGTFEARLRDPAGAAIDNAEITVEPGNLSARSSGGGAYVLGSLAPGRYAVTVRHRAFRERMVLVDVAAGGNRQEIVLERIVREPPAIVKAPSRPADESDRRNPRSPSVETVPERTPPPSGPIVAAPAPPVPAPTTATPPAPVSTRSTVLAHDALDRAIKALDEDGDVGRAEILLAEAQRLDPESKEVAQQLARVREIRAAEVRQRVRDHLSRAERLFREAGEPERALREVEAALRLLPSDPQARGLREEIQKVMSVGVKKPS